MEDVPFGDRVTFILHRPEDTECSVCGAAAEYVIAISAPSLFILFETFGQ